MTTPRIIEPLTHSAILQRMLTLTQGSLRPTDPLYLDGSATAAYVFAHRAQLNERLLGLFIDFAQGSDLDAIVSEYSVVRAVGETDAALRVRAKATVDSAGAAGTDEAYIAAALAADSSVASVGIFPNTTTDMVDLYVTTLTRAPTAGLVAIVQAAINASPRKAILDRVNVVAATDAVIYIRAQVIYPFGTAQSQAQVGIAANLVRLTALARQLGRTLTLAEAQTFLSAGGYAVNIQHFHTAAPVGGVDIRTASIAHTAVPPVSEAWLLNTTFTYSEGAEISG